MQAFKKTHLIFLLSLLSKFFICLPAAGQSCSTCTGVTTISVDLSANPDTSWTVSSTRAGQCCQGTGSDKCIVFNVIVSPRATEIRFIYKNGSANNGTYEINCDPATEQSPGTVQCLGGLTSFCITYCAPGNANDPYTITTSSGFTAGADVTLQGGCTGQLNMSGLLESTLSWNSVYPGALGAYNSWLSCTTGCDTTFITPGAGAPPYVDFQVCGARTGCTTGNYCDTQRVMTVPPLSLAITPANPAVCTGQNPTLAASISGGLPPYTYAWSTGDTTFSINAGVGTYSVLVTDATNCAAVLDSVTVTTQPAATSNAGANASVCGGIDYTLSGIVGNATSSYWTTTGTGSFNDSTLLAATYTPSSADVLAGNVNLILTAVGPCAPVRDTMRISYGPVQNAVAGNDQTLCSNITSVSLNASASSSPGIWSTNGTGTFSPNNATPNANYNPSAADKSSGSVTLTYTIPPVSGCPGDTDAMVLTIVPGPTANAGIDQSVCASTPSVTLNGSYTLAGGATWSGGNGNFTPNASTLNASYTPTPAEISSGAVSLILSTTGNGICLAARDTMMISFVTVLSGTAGVDMSACAATPSIPLSPDLNSAATVLWTSEGSGSFSPNNTTLNASYLPSSADTASGSVSLALRATNACSIFNDTLVLTFVAMPSSNAGIDQTICAGNTVQLAGNVTASAGGRWTTTGTGTFAPNDSTLSAVYTPASGDAGTLTFTLTTIGNANCAAVTDMMSVVISPLPAVQAGNDVSLCDVNSVPLNGQVTGGASPQWTTSGDGSFTNATLLNTSYQPGPTDSSSGSVSLVLASTNGCGTARDTLVIRFGESPVVNAGADQTICSNDTLMLNGSTLIANSFQWSTSGNGTFIPNNTTINAGYKPSADDELAGSVDIVLMATNGCGISRDTIDITVLAEPVAYASTDQTTCYGYNAQLNPYYANANGFHWHTMGTGTFSPNDSDDFAIYIPSAADLTAGTVTLYMTVTNSCATDVDSMRLSFYPKAAANAGADTTLCEGLSLQLNGSMVNSVGCQWSSFGDGAFSPNELTLNAMYTPGPVDIANGSVTLVLRPFAAQNCPITRDTITLTIVPMAMTLAGNDTTLCAVAAIPLNGQVSGTTAHQWSTTGDGNFLPNNTTLNATYQPGLSDTISGSVQLILSGTSTCGNASDTIQIWFTQAPTANAGLDQVYCTGDSIILNGIVTGTSNVQWTTFGTGTFVPNNTTLSAMYVPSILDELAGGVDLVLSASGCGTANDSVYITLTAAPQAYAGTDQTVCAGANVNLVPWYANASGFHWNTTGDGMFTPNDSDFNAVYNPGSNDSIAGSAVLYMTVTNSCSTVADSINITFRPRATANAGSDQSVCDGSSVQLNGSLTASAGGVWATMGFGTFQPNATAMNAVYIPGPGDITAGSASIVLVPFAIGLCPVTVDTVTIVFDSKPVADFTSSTSCVNSITTFTDATTIQNGTVTSWTWSFGTGSSNVQNPTFTFSQPGTETIILIAATAGGCADTISKSISVNATPAAVFVSQVACPDTAWFTDASTLTGSNITSWSWDFGDQTTGNAQHPMHVFPGPGDYPVMLTVTSDSGCVSTVTNSVHLEPCNDNTPQAHGPALPTAFTPNMDGKNDMLFVRGGPFLSLEFRVYNEWGVEVFHSDSPSIGWDGSYRNKQQPTGKYIWSVKCVTTDNDEYQMVGQVVLHR